jgi:predicted nuclease of predicted toxin-antitoxin system
MDVHVPYAVTLGLRLVHVSVITAQEDGFAEAEDDVLLDRATSLNCPLVSQDDDLLAEAKHRLTNSIPFGGVIYGHQQRVNIGIMVRDLELIAKVYDAQDMLNRVEYLPL